jgi:predicted SnoaL-like aldol condensation-catalyzing enzyme
MTQAENVQRCYLDLNGADAPQAFARHCASSYIEHQESARFSSTGFLDWVARRRVAYPERRLIVHRAIVDGAYVFLHVEERLSDAETFSRGELFRVEASKLVEHWSAAVLDLKARKNPHTSFDGPQVNLASRAAARWVDRFQQLDDRGFNGYEFEAFTASRTPRYLQHSPGGRDTVQGLVEVLQRVQAMGIRFAMTNYRTMVAGDFIVTHRLYKTTPPYAAYRTINVFDLFRFDESGQVDEHWDVMEEIADEANIPRIFGAA